MAFLGLGFICCALLLGGLPPFPGSCEVCAACRGYLPASARRAPAAGPCLALLMFRAWPALIALCRTGILFFWAAGQRRAALRVIEVRRSRRCLCCAWRWRSGRAGDAYTATAEALREPAAYIDAVIRHARRALTCTPLLEGNAAL